MGRSLYLLYQLCTIIICQLDVTNSYNHVEKFRHPNSLSRSHGTMCGRHKHDNNFTRCQKTENGYLAYKSNDDSWPWMTTVLFNRVPACSGILIDDRYVLTSAQCVYNKTKSQFSIISMCKPVLPNPSRSIISVQEITIHPNYDGFTNYDDLAIIHLTTPVPTNCLICLPDANETLEKDSTCIFTGWEEKLADTDDIKKPMYEVCQPYIPRKDCEPYYGTNFNEDTLLCAGYDVNSFELNATMLAKYRGPCEHNIGSPLVCKINNIWILYGLSTSTVNCKFQKFPNLYTDVRSYMKWITTIVK